MMTPTRTPASPSAEMLIEKQGFTGTDAFFYSFLTNQQRKLFASEDRERHFPKNLVVIQETSLARQTSGSHLAMHPENTFDEASKYFVFVPRSKTHPRPYIYRIQKDQASTNAERTRVGATVAFSEKISRTRQEVAEAEVKRATQRKLQVAEDMAVTVGELDGRKRYKETKLSVIEALRDEGSIDDATMDKMDADTGSEDDSVSSGEPTKPTKLAQFRSSNKAKRGRNNGN